MTLIRSNNSRHKTVLHLKEDRTVFEWGLQCPATRTIRLSFFAFFFSYSLQLGHTVDSNRLTAYPSQEQSEMSQPMWSSRSDRSNWPGDLVDEWSASSAAEQRPCWRKNEPYR